MTNMQLFESMSFESTPHLATIERGGDTGHRRSRCLRREKITSVALGILSTLAMMLKVEG